jgi:hypothetical protein
LLLSRPLAALGGFVLVASLAVAVPTPAFATVRSMQVNTDDVAGLQATRSNQRDFRMAVVEASGGRVGTSLDRVLQFCFKYDPMTQRYTPFAMAFVRIGAGLSCLALMGLLAVLWRRELLMRRRRLA